MVLMVLVPLPQRCEHGVKLVYIGHLDEAFGDFQAIAGLGSLKITHILIVENSTS